MTFSVTHGRWSTAVLALALAACGSDDPTESDTGSEDVSGDVTTDAAPDTDATEPDTGVDAEPDQGTDADPDATTDAVEDADAEPVETLGFELQWPIFETPTDSLAETEIDGCTVYQEEVCGDSDELMRCEIYDASTSEWVDEPDDMLRRAYLYDRWYDLYSQPDGQTAERSYQDTMEPGTPEEVWADPENFAGYRGAGDSAIWTGTALNAFIMRYLVTGTEADYQRMEDKTRVMLRFFEITRIPGYLARHHYLLVEPGTPAHPDHIYRWHPDDDDHRDIEDPAGFGWLPDHYFEDAGTARWSGDPSIDQMGGPMIAFPMVYPMIRDEELREQMVYQMTCYLHRLRRIEITNLQENEMALDAFNSFFGGGQLQLDPDDIDFSELEEIIMYVHPQFNSANEDIYDRECGEFIQMEPWRVLDASSSEFVFDVLDLFQDIDRERNGRNHINHFYIPSIRGGDAMHMMHLALMAYAFTGDERYADFLRDELLGRIRTAEVSATMSALIMPRYCRRFYGTNITAGPLWAFTNLLAPGSELDTWMQEVFRDEMWAKETADVGNVNTNLMFAGTVTPEIGGEGREEALQYALEELARFGGNGGILDDPRRDYYRSFEEVVENLPDGIAPRCATAEEREFCEADISVFGATVDGERISFECTGAASECVMEDGLCTTAHADGPIPGPWRYWGDYSWQRSPFRIGDENGNGTVQSPGSDYSEQYWMARFYGFIEGGQEVLAWRSTGEACE